jgi:hypothetical protein
MVNFENPAVAAIRQNGQGLPPTYFQHGCGPQVARNTCIRSGCEELQLNKPVGKIGKAGEFFRRQTLALRTRRMPSRFESSTSL